MITKEDFCCEVCGKDATCAVMDLQETDNSAMWRTWKISKLHTRCDDHPCKTTRHYLDGAIEVDD